MRILAYIACAIGIIAISIPILMAIAILLIVFLIDPLPFILAFLIIGGIIAGLWGMLYLQFGEKGA